MDGRCATCFYWSKRQENVDYPEFHPCDMVGDEGVIDGEKFFVDSPYNHWVSRLWTAPDFGCVHWEAEPE